ncbi:WD40 repeat domain-containing protein [Streptomyces sp. NPDC097619]|uniref:WD40 repeat domain-containing protein n=1 Tax=Streptomyces sp. NPDC097619 TaxID=3157228 RepID=UPI0033263E82
MPVVLAVLVVAVPVGGAVAAEGAPGTSSFTIEDPRITESSGLAASRAHPGVYWTHNDSDDGPYLYGVDSATGRTVARITMTGVGDPRDVEAVSVGPDGALYVGDIGDNRNGTWDHVWIYRLPEPKALGESTVRATQFTVRYADGPRDAEALMVHPVTGRVYIASKSEDGAGLYEGPVELSAGRTNVFRRVGEVPWVTDGAFSPDGKELTLRGYFSADSYPWRDGRIAGEGRRLRAPFLWQAESVAYSPDGSTLMFGAEGKGSRVVALPVERPEGGSGEGSGGDAAGQGSGSGAAREGSGGAAGSAGGAAAAGEGGDADFGKGALVLALGTALVLGLRRLARSVRRGG